LSGQVHGDAAGNVVNGPIAQQTAACIANIKAILAAAGSSIEKVVKVTVFLTNADDFAEMNNESAKHFISKPARSCVIVKELPKGFQIEIECIALV
jgi:2-iminobutanoate/2-iminopropanoate deaminase